jgi:hypothetical protein
MRGEEEEDFGTEVACLQKVLFQEETEALFRTDLANLCVPFNPDKKAG